MSNYTVRTVTEGTNTYHFISRGRSKEFTDEEVSAYMHDLHPKAEKKEFRVEGTLRKIFAQDLRFGLKHCCQKYGATKEQLLEEAKRLFPQMNIDRIVGLDE